jgi:hypothetical protein
MRPDVEEEVFVAVSAESVEIIACVDEVVHFVSGERIVRCEVTPVHSHEGATRAESVHCLVDRATEIGCVEVVANLGENDEVGFFVGPVAG